MARISRFDCASSSLRLKALLRKTQRVLWGSFGLGVGLHLSLMQIGRSEAEHKVVKPLTMQFIKRQPRLTKPLELKKRPQPKRRRLQRRMVSVKAKMQRNQRAGRFQPVEMLKGLAKPSVEVGRVAAFERVGIEPRSIAEVIEGTKEAEQKIDMSLELLDIEALNTGKHHAMVIQDPHDKRNIQGFCCLSYFFIPRLHQTVVPHTSTGTTWFQYIVAGAVRNLVHAMNAYTLIDAQVGQKIVISDPEVFRTPWIYLFFIARQYAFSDVEADMMGRYMMQGGFVFADSHPADMMSVASSHEDGLRAALESQGVERDFEILPGTHPIYHCYFDFNGPPDATDGLIRAGDYASWEHPGYLEGLIVEDRLVAILSRKGYYHPWAQGDRATYDTTRHFQFGVNTIVFALTEEGSITHRLMDSIK